jgi:hypothetical protein
VDQAREDVGVEDAERGVSVQGRDSSGSTGLNLTMQIKFCWCMYNVIIAVASLYEF